MRRLVVAVRVCMRGVAGVALSIAVYRTACIHCTCGGGVGCVSLHIKPAIQLHFGYI